MDENEREIWVGENRLYLNEDNILYMTVTGEINDKTAFALVDAATKLENMVDGKVNFFADINDAKKQSSGARAMFKDRSERSEKAGKIAVYGLHPVARVIALFIISATKKKDIRFFKKKEVALAWLKE